MAEAWQGGGREQSVALTGQHQPRPVADSRRACNSLARANNLMYLPRATELLALPAMYDRYDFHDAIMPHVVRPFHISGNCSEHVKGEVFVRGAD